MELLILSAVAAFFIKTAFIDTTAMVTGRTPPSHAYRMAKLKAETAKNRQRAADPDDRGGLGQVFRHWYLDACEDLDHWRQHRHDTREERKAAAQRRREERVRQMREWDQPTPRSEDPPEDPKDEDIVDAEVVEDPPPSPADGERPGGARRWRRTTTTTTTEEEEEEETAPSDELVPLRPTEEGEQPPLPHRRMVLATMIAAAGHTPDWEALGRMDSDQVDAAISGLVALRRGERRPEEAR